MGQDKALLRLGSGSILDRTLNELRRISDDVIVVGRDADGREGVRAVPDAVQGAGPVGGLLAGLRAARYPLCAVVACDHPFLTAESLAGLADLAEGHEVVVPRVGGKPQPTHALYRRDLIAPVDAFMDGGGRALHRLLALLDVRWVDEDELAILDPGGRSLINVNTPEEWERARGPASTSE